MGALTNPPQIGPKKHRRTVTPEQIASIVGYTVRGGIHPCEHGAWPNLTRRERLLIQRRWRAAALVLVEELLDDALRESTLSRTRSTLRLAYKLYHNLRVMGGPL